MVFHSLGADTHTYRHLHHSDFKKPGVAPGLKYSFIMCECIYMTRFIKVSAPTSYVWQGNYLDVNNKLFWSPLSKICIANSHLCSMQLQMQSATHEVRNYYETSINVHTSHHIIVVFLSIVVLVIDHSTYWCSTQ